MSVVWERRALLAYTLLLMSATVALESIAPSAATVSSAGASLSLLLYLAWVVWHSIKVRGSRPTAHFLGIAAAVAFATETLAVNATEVFHHHLHPQILQVPVQIVCGWVVYLYAGFAMTLALVGPVQSGSGGLAFCVVAALVTTVLDLIADPVGVRLGAFTYHQGGAFMPEIEGTNGAHGIPLGNYVGWMLVATGTNVLFWLRSRPGSDETAHGRVEALLFYLTVFVATAIPALRLGYVQLLLIGGLPVALVALLLTYRLLADRRTRKLAVRRSRQRARVTNLADRRFAIHRR